MPTKKEGYSQLNVLIPDPLARELDAIAKGGEQTKGELVEHALRGLLEGGIERSMSENLHERLSMLTTTQHDTVKVLSHLQQTVNRFEQRLIAHEQSQERKYTTLVEAFDRFRTHGQKPAESLRKRLGFG